MDMAIRLSAPGGVEGLQRIDWPPQSPEPGDIRLRHAAIGLNFIDIYHRTGLYPLPSPCIPGVEGVGIVEAVGDGVVSLKVGDRIAYAGAAGAYAATRTLPAWRAIRLPADVSSECAAASMLRGLTAHMLLTRTYLVSAGSTLLVHAAAGGLGTILMRWAKHLGATVIGTAGSDAKAQLAHGNGADHVVVGRDADVAAEVARLTDGRGVDFAIDGIGGTMVAHTIACVRRFGTVASVGQAAGPIPPVAVEDLGPARSLTFARPSVMAYAAEHDTYPLAMRAVLEMIRAGVIAGIGTTYPLAEAQTAHLDLEGGRIVGSAILVP